MEQNVEPVVQAEQPNAPNASDKEVNFSRFREKEKRLESQLDQQNQLIQQMANQLNSLQQANQRPEPGFLEKYGFEAGGFVEPEKLARALEEERRHMEKIAEKVVEAKGRQLFEQQEKSRFAERLRNRYSDYEQVVTNDNLEELERNDPIFARSLTHVADEYDRREMAYQKIKTLVNNRLAKTPSAQELVDKNKSSSMHYASGGSEGTPASVDLVSFQRDPAARKRAYEQLKAAQKRGLTR